MFGVMETQNSFFKMFYGASKRKMILLNQRTVQKKSQLRVQKISNANQIILTNQLLFIFW
jgi:hypothetical protein